MLKILCSESSENGGAAADLRLEGRVVGPWVGEVRRISENILAAGKTMTIDMTEVAFIDGEGLNLFRWLGRHHVTLMNCSGFITEQLRACEGSDHGNDDRAAG